MPVYRLLAYEAPAFRILSYVFHDKFTEYSQKKYRKMKKVKVLKDFTRISVAMLIEFARHVVSHMTGNPLFATPDVPLADITAKTDKLEQKFLAAQGGGTLHTAEMKDARKDLIDALDIEALYVTKIAKGNETVVISSGFTGTRQPQPTLRPDFRVVSAGIPGEITAKHKAITKAMAYCWQFCVSETVPAEETWVWAGVSTQAKMCITNLEVGKRVWVRCCGVTRYGMAPWCDPLMIQVL
jgi:hypothetical protein